MRREPSDERIVDKGTLTTAVDYGGLANVELVIESVVEQVDIKAAVLRKISEFVGPSVPIVSNTSGIPVDELANFVKHPERFFVTHFMNPAYMKKGIEVARGDRTSQDSLDTVVAWLRSQLALDPVVVGDGPGFVVNLLLQLMIAKSIRLVESGMANAESTDKLIVTCLEHKTGPLRTADLIGLDNVLDTLTELSRRLKDSEYEPPQLLCSMVAAGHLGRKAGRGFYSYGDAAAV
jgi:methoxymalonate biosynthesis protein